MIDRSPSSQDLSSGRPGARDRLLNVADRLFYAEGIRAVGVDRIVEESGTAKATLYAHFPSKGDLVASYLRRRCDLWCAYLLAELPNRAGEPWGRILAVFDLLGESFESADYRGCPFINASAEFADQDHPARIATAEYRARIRRLFLDLAAEAKIEDAEGTAEAIAMLYDGAMVSAQLDGNARAAARARVAAECLLS